ncbi:hypothetical protein VPNG_06667 [Cytospora leucostoma]|uniref:DUF7082 domain-containing protein n=1 Tax=Cytospora leucostoma TaxID=1230097 RepID=A0A423WU72_9PEZI|nr:hypothetical protein VPNG_06667 [Cytospora leucostoma]
MSALKVDQPTYKLFEPGFHPQRPIIVDADALESPDTVTLRYEEEAAVRANGGGGDLRGGSSPDLLPMAAYKPHPPQMHGFSESPYSQYSPQSLSQAHLQQQSENAASQMNQMAFAANNVAAVAANNQNSYFALSTSGFTTQGSQPSAGPSGTRIQVRISGQYDIMSVTSTPPYAWVVFGNAAQRYPAQLMKETQDGSGACTYSIATHVPPFLSTNWQTPSNVPLTVLIESADGNELARVDSAGSFTYTDPAGADISQGAASPPDEPITRRSTTRSPPSHEHDTSVLQVNSPPGLTVRTSATTSPTTEHLPGTHQLPLPTHDVADPGTNTYGYPPTAVAQSQTGQVQLPQAQPATSFGAASYNQSNDTMLHAYRTSNYAHNQHHHYQRSPTSLRSSHHGLGGWATYGGLDGRSSGYSSAHHTSITRPSLTPSLPMPSGGPPALVRTTSLPQGNPSMGLGGTYNPFATHHKAVLHIQGNLDSMAVGWTPEEWENRRRIVMFKKSQTGSRLTATFRAVPVNERPPNSICISCIWWEEKRECFVTSVDTIHLLEQLVAAPNRFTVEEKNRIRRNLEGFKPLTVSKAKSESEDFFKIIMGFGNPKPRNIEKDVKVFPWKVLAPALKKIIGKYSASPSSTVPQSTHHHTHLLTPVSVGSNNYGLPPTPTTATDPTSATGYIGSAGMSNHPSLNDNIPSPRSLTGGMPSSWTGYPSTGRDATRGFSPNGLLKTSSPAPSSSLRLSTLPTAYDTRSSQGSLSNSNHYGLQAQSSHHGLSATQTSHPGRWDYSVNSISDTSGYGGTRGGYDYSAYGDGASQRA